MNKSFKVKPFKVIIAVLILIFSFYTFVLCKKFESLDGLNVMPDSGKVSKIVVFIHGFGSNANNMIGLSESYSKALPNTAFYAPNAPDLVPAYINSRENARQWFSDKDWTFEDKPGIERATKFLEAYIDNLVLKHSLDYKDVAVVGFSQGTMTSLYALPRFKHELAGLVAFSGGTLWLNELQGEDYQRFPILIYHGKKDNTVPHKYSQKVEKKLKKLGFSDVELILEDDLNHSISKKGLDESTKFLKRVLLYSN